MASAVGQASARRHSISGVIALRAQPGEGDPSSRVVFEAGWRETFEKFDPIPNHKTDTNNHGPFSFDNIGMNWDYPEATYERRREILKEHERYQKGWLYFIANDPRVPKEVQEAMQKWGLAKDEFTDSGGWPHQIYVREARRMVGAYVMRQQNCQGFEFAPEPIGLASWNRAAMGALRPLMRPCGIATPWPRPVEPRRSRANRLSVISARDRP